MSDFFARNSDYSSTLGGEEMNQEFDDPLFPDVTGINKVVQNEDESEEMEVDNDEWDKSSYEEDMPSNEPDGISGSSPTDYPIRCRSIRIGSCKIHPYNNSSHVSVNLSTDAISFGVCVLNDPKHICIRLTCQDIIKVLMDFGSLPLLFLYTTANFGENVRKLLNLNSLGLYFDPLSKNEKVQMITFLIDHITNDQCDFLRHCFPGEKKVKEISQKEANEILMRSTPYVLPIKIASTPDYKAKLFTYPLPPQTGEIAVTLDDLNRLYTTRFLNDVIIDFYLKYIVNELLTPSQREKVHGFNSYFYSCVSKKPGQSTPKQTDKLVPDECYNIVKRWTKNVDIFSKDFIIIPVNHELHWLLVVICFPNHVPEVTECAPKSEVESNDSSDKMFSTVEQERNNQSRVFRELSNKGEGNNLNQDENSTSSVNSTYLVPVPRDSDKPAEASDNIIPPDGGEKKEMPCICIFDSLRGHDRGQIDATLREYLTLEWKTKKRTNKVFNTDNMPGFFIDCPQQTNSYDCGLYLLQFAQSFFENPFPYFGNPMPDLRNWFSVLEMSRKREEIGDLIDSIHREQVEVTNEESK